MAGPQRLDKGVSKVLHSCALLSIRKNYPSADENYIPFKESHEDEARQLYGDNFMVKVGPNFADDAKFNPLSCRHTTCLCTGLK